MRGVAARIVRESRIIIRMNTHRIRNDGPRAAPARGSPAGEIAADLAAILWPGACAGCGFPDRELCVSCRVEIRLAGERPVWIGDADPPVLAAGPYDGALRGALLALKHGGRTSLARELGEALGAVLEAAARHCAGPDAPILVPVPSRASHVRVRGFRPVSHLITTALRARPIPALRVDALRATRGRVSQQGLSLPKRAENAERIGVRRSRARVLAGRDVILVDDVRTTGATTVAAAGALRAAGARVPLIAVLCAVQRRDAA